MPRIPSARESEILAISARNRAAWSSPSGAQDKQNVAPAVGRAPSAHSSPAVGAAPPVPRTAGQALAEAQYQRWKDRESRDSADRIYPLVALCRAHELPEPVPEFRFDAVRRFRFDYAFPLHRVAVEIDGGVWSGGRHTRGEGFIRDQQKTNLAAKLGWYVLRYTPDRLAECVADLRIMFAGKAA